MLRWKDSDVEFFVPQLAAVLMSKGVPSRNVHVSVHRYPGVASRWEGMTHGTGLGCNSKRSPCVHVCCDDYWSVLTDAVTVSGTPSKFWK